MDSSDCDHHCNMPDDQQEANRLVDSISHGFNQHIDHLDHKIDEEHNHDINDNDDEEAEDDFTFMLVGHDEDPNSFDDKVFEDGKIRPVFPLFDQNLLLDGEYHIEEIEHLPVLPPVDKIFIESPRGHLTSTPKEHEHNDDDGSATGPYCEWSKDSPNTVELSKKSNSTGFSKLWRLREMVGRSNSDGRDAFVFLKHSDKSSATAPKTSSYASTSSRQATSDGTFVKVNVAEGKARVVKQGTKAKKPTVSAHEAYLRNRGHTEEERRRSSYLPYRPELMGLFTNVHGGLSKNVHPY